MSASLDIIIVNWNSGELLRECLKSIVATDRNGFELCRVLVADNASWDGSASELEDLQLPLSIIHNTENLGFARAVNICLKRSSGEFILLINPDVVIKSDSLQPMIEFIRSHQSIGICGCKLLNQDGSLQYSKGSFPTLFSTLYRMLLPRRMRKYHLSGYENVEECDWVTGAFMMIRHEVIEEIGFFDEEFFLCYEDVDLCIRAKQKGWKTFYYPGVSAYHLNPYHLRSKLSSINKNTELEVRRSQLHFFKKHLNIFSYKILKLLAFLFFWVMGIVRRLMKAI